MPNDAPPPGPTSDPRARASASGGQGLRSVVGSLLLTPVHASPDALRLALKIVFCPLLAPLALAIVATGIVTALAFWA